MTIKERRRVLYFLEMLLAQIENRERTEIKAILLTLFSRKELIEIVLWLYNNYDKAMLSEKTEAELLKLIEDDANVLAYVIEQWKAAISAVPKLTQEQVHEFFDELQLDPHYLRNKPIEQWDECDVSNYYSLLLKKGKTRRVYAIFTSDVKAEDKYIVTTQPSFFFDTKEEAEKELERFCLESKRSTKDFIIHSLWKIN